MRVLITGVGGSAGQNLVACLRKAGGYTIIGGDMNRYHLAVADCDERVLLPPTDNQDAWRAAIRDIACDAILPQPDCDVAAIAGAVPFSAKVALPVPTSVECAHDKLFTIRKLDCWDIPTPMTLVVSPTTLDEVLQVSTPVWLRTRHGAGSRGACKAFTVTQALEWIDYQRCRGLQDDFLVHDYLPGREYGIQQLWWDGLLVASFARERLEYLFGYLSATGQTSSPSVARTVHRPDLITTATKAVQAISFGHPHGVYGVDIKEDLHGVAKVTEINVGRFYTTSLFMAEAGLNLPHYLCQLLAGGTTGPIPAVDPDLYWVRTMDCRPALVHARDLDRIKETAPCL